MLCRLSLGSVQFCRLSLGSVQFCLLSLESVQFCRLSPGSVQFSTKRSNAATGTVTSKSVKQVTSPFRSVLPAHSSAATTRVTSFSAPPKGTQPPQFDSPAWLPAVSLCLLPVSQHTYVSVVHCLPTFFIAGPFTVDGMKENGNGALMERKVP